MDHFHLMQVFVAVAEEEGFAAAARRLQSSPPAVTRAIAALERQLGVKLLDRTTRYVRSTEAGLRYLEDSRRILAEVEAADEAVAGINSEPRGHLTVTAPVLFGRLCVMPAIIKYLKHFPDAEVSAVFLDRVVNLLEEGLDVSVRIGDLPDSSMRALKVGSIRQVLCASPEYLAENGLPQHPNDLRQHELITSSAGSAAPAWRFLVAGEDMPLRVESRLTATTNDAAIEAATEGFGIARLLSYQVAPQVASGELVILLEAFERPQQPVHILHREGRYTSAKVRTFIDMLAAHLRDHEALN